MTIAKRKATEYNIFVGTKTDALPTLKMIGTVVAFTPQQARRKGATEFADTLVDGNQPAKRSLYAVPSTSMRFETVTVRRVPVISNANKGE